MLFSHDYLWSSTDIFLSSINVCFSEVIIIHFFSETTTIFCIVITVKQRILIHINDF